MSAAPASRSAEVADIVEKMDDDESSEDDAIVEQLPLHDAHDDRSNESKQHVPLTQMHRSRSDMPPNHRKHSLSSDSDIDSAYHAGRRYTASSTRHQRNHHSNDVNLTVDSPPVEAHGPAPALTRQNSLSLAIDEYNESWRSEFGLWDSVSLTAYEWSLQLTAINWIVAFSAIQFTSPLALGQSTSLALSHPWLYIYLLLALLAQMALTCFAHRGMHTELSHLFVRPIKVCNMYLHTLLTFALLYLLIFATDRQSFHIEGFALSTGDDAKWTPTVSGATVNLDSVTNGEPITDLTSSLSDRETANDILSVCVFMIYFSITIMTSTGFGDCVPIRFFSQFPVNVHMLTACVYNIAVFGLTVSHFQSFERLKEAHAKRKKQLLERAFADREELPTRANSVPAPHLNNNGHIVHSVSQATLQNHSDDESLPQATRPQQHSINVARVAEDAMNDLAALTHSGATHVDPTGYNLGSSSYALMRRQEAELPSLLSQLITHLLTSSHSIIDRTRVWLLHHLLLFSLLAQLAILFLMTAIIGAGFASRMLLYLLVVTLLACQLFLVASVSLKLVSRINSNDLTLTFLASSYASTTLAFSSLYLLLFVAAPSHEFSINVTELTVNESHSLEYVFQLLCILIYFGFTAMSGTGFGDIYARGSIGRAFVSVQMIVSVAYGIIIFGLGLSLLIQRQDKQARKEFVHVVQEISQHAHPNSPNSHNNQTHNQYAHSNSHLSLPPSRDYSKSHDVILQSQRNSAAAKQSRRNNLSDGATHFDDLEEKQQPVQRYANEVHSLDSDHESMQHSRSQSSFNFKRSSNSSTSLVTATPVVKSATQRMDSQTSLSSASKLYGSTDDAVR